MIFNFITHSIWSCSQSELEHGKLSVRSAHGWQVMIVINGQQQLGWDFNHSVLFSIQCKV